MPQHTLHGDDLAWLELQLAGLVPTGYGRPDGAPSLAVPAGLVAAGQDLDLLDPEGVTLARLHVDRSVPVPGDERDLLDGAATPVSEASHPDHRDLRLRPDDLDASAGNGHRVAVWGGVPSTLAFRRAACRWADDHEVPVVELVGVASGRVTDARAHLGVRLARRQTTRRDGDALVVVPWPGLGWGEDGVRLRAFVAAAFGAQTLLVPVALDPVTAARVTSATGVRPVQPDVEADQALTTPDELPALLDAPDDDLGWLAEPEVLPALRASVRPRDRAGFTVLLSGLSGSGKSTVARGLAVRLMEDDLRSVSLLDGDVVRHHLSKGLGFSRDDRDVNVRRIGYVASEITKAGGIAVCAPIAPYDATRKAVRAMVEEQGGFVLVHVATPLAECERRDRKGLYAKARRGEIPEFTGISDPYESPADAELTIDTTGRPVDECVDAVVSRLRDLGYLPG